MSYYNYHAEIRRRISNGELCGYHYETNYPKIGECLVLEFSTFPPQRPIRPHSQWRYADILGSDEQNESKRRK